MLKIVLTAGGKSVELTPDEARALLLQLKRALGDDAPLPVVIPAPYVYPMPMWPRLPEVWCRGDTTAATFAASTDRSN